VLHYCLELSHSEWLNGDPATSVERLFEVIRMADELAFDSVWLTEDPDGWDAFAVLGAAARQTQSIRLGTGVTNPFLRHPNLIAASVSTLDRLSDGRAFLGLGRGQPEWYRVALGMDVGSPLAALESAIDLLRRWWQPPHIAHGRVPFPVKEWERSINPLRMPPIYLAAVGERALALAGRVADGVRFNELASPEYLRDAIALVRKSAVDAGRNPDALSFFVHPGLVVTDDRERELERKKAMIAFIHALPGMDRQLHSPGIDVDRVMADVRAHMRTEEVLARGGAFADLRRSGDLAAAKRAIPLELMERVSIVGTAPYVRARLRELAEIGATHLFVDIERTVGNRDNVEELLGSIDITLDR
jgi:5,10-methylenetetrahydromethanopterin reductase